MSRYAFRTPFPAFLLILSMALSACGTPTPTPTPVPTPTPAPTATPTPLPLDTWVADGAAALAASDFAAAEAAYQKALAADPAYAPAAIGLAWTYSWQLNRAADALDAARKATELAPKDAAAWAVLAYAHYRNDQTAEAVKSGEQAVELDPGSAVAQATLARAYADDLQHDAAFKAAREAVKLDPQSAYAYTALAVAHEAMADYGRAQAAVEQAISLQPEFAQWRIHLGDLLSERLRYEAAQAAYEKALALAPDHPRALLGLARLHGARQEYQKAEALAAQAAQVAPAVAGPLLDWGYLYLLQQDYEKATAKFQEAAKLAPDDWAVQSAQADARLRQGDCESAASMLQDLTASHPRVASLRIDSSWAKWCLGDTSRALELAREATKLDPYSSGAHWMMGMLLVGQERWEEATADYLIAARYAGAPVAAHSALGDSFLDQDEVDKAETEFALAARLDPYDAKGSTGLCTVNWWNNKFEQMLAPCEQAARLEPKSEHNQAMWGIALCLNDRDDEAITVLQANLEENPENPLSHLYLGRAYLLQKQYALANKSLETYQKLSESDDSRLTYLIDAVGQGWELREAVALDDLQEISEQIVDHTADWQMESTGEMTRTLTVALKADKGETPESVYQVAAQLLAVSAYYASRITPAVNGGAIVRAADAAGKSLFAVEIASDDMWLYLSTETGSQTFTDAINFIQPAGGIRSPEMTDKLVQATVAEAAELRELKAKEPFTSKRLDQAGLEAYLEESLDEESETEAHNDDLLLTMLGALDPEANLWEDEKALESEQILGFYDEEDKTFYVVSDKAPGLTDRTTVAHEYVHVLQDQHFGIGAARKEIDNDDQSIAYLTLVEGDASLVEAQYMQEKLPELELAQTMEAAETGVGQEQLERSPAVLREWLSFPYVQGATFVAEVFATGGWEAVNEIYDNPPVSTEQLLHPERYRAGEKPVEVALPDLAETLGGGWRVAHDKNTVGELTWRLILTEIAGPAAAEAAADGWGGDSYVLLQEGEDGAGAALLRSEWDTADDAEEFWGVLRVALAIRAGFDEVVVDLTGDGLARHFRGPDAYWIVQLDGKAVTLAIGPTVEVAEKLFKAK